MIRYEDTSRWEQRPEPIKTAPITPEQLIYLGGGPPPEKQHESGAPPVRKESGRSADESGNSNCGIRQVSQSVHP